MKNSYEIRLAQMALEQEEVPVKEPKNEVIRSGIRLSPREVALNARSAQLLISVRSDDYVRRIQDAFAKEYDRRPNILYLGKKKQLKKQIKILGEGAQETLLVLPRISDREYDWILKNRIFELVGGIAIEEVGS